jgi:hypothetical protein
LNKRCFKALARTIRSPADTTRRSGSRGDDFARNEPGRTLLRKRRSGRSSGLSERQSQRKIVRARCERTRFWHTETLRVVTAGDRLRQCQRFSASPPSVASLAADRSARHECCAPCGCRSSRHA